MSCRRAQEIDLVAFAADRTAREWRDFRDHYPSCADCSRAVARLGALESVLRAAGTSGVAHLDDEAMLSMADGELSGEALARAEAHLADCAACRSEMSVLRAFDLERVAAEQERRASAPPGGATVTSLVDRLRTRGSARWTPGAHVGWAAAAAAALVVFWVMTLGPEEASTPQIAAESGAPTEPAARGGLPDGPIRAEGDPGSPVDATQLADAANAQDPPAEPPESSAMDPDSVHEAPVTPGDPAPVPSAQPETRIAEAPALPDVTERPEPLVDASEPEPSREEARGEVLLLAAAFPREMPSYRLPYETDPHGLDAVRIGGALRTPRPGVGRVQVLAPVHAGLSHRAAPTLYWVVENPGAAQVEFVLNDSTSIEPILEKRFPAPVAPGLHAVDLAAEGVTLDAGEDYEWSVALISDEAARETDILSQGVVRRVAVPADAEAGDAQTPAREVHRLAASGSWYDAFDVLNGWIEAMPGETRLREYRRSLVAQVGLEAFVDSLSEPNERAREQEGPTRSE